MKEFRHTLNQKDLLAQAGRLHAIARRLVGDGHAAEDVVQDTWVAALESEMGTVPDSRDSEGWRAWARVVTRNLSLRRARRERERRVREREVSRPESSEETHELVSRLQLQQRLGEAILDLEDPYRSAIVLRYLDGLSLEEIAERQCISNANARKRVSRALAMLRARLSGEENSARGLLGSWIGWLLSKTSTLTIGSALMGTKTNVGIAATVLAALVLVWSVREDPLSGVTAPPDQESHETATLEAPRRETESALALSYPLAETEPEARLADEVAAPQVRQLTGRVTNTTGEPLAEVRVVWCDAQGNALGSASPDLTEATGVYQLERRPIARWVSFEREPYVRSILSLPDADELDVTLLRKPRMTGQVRAAGSGVVAPPGVVNLVVQLAGSAGTVGFDTALQTDGGYAFEGLPVGQLVSVTARAKGFDTYEAKHADELVPEQTLALDLELPRGLTIVGVVRDAVTKEPIPFAQVWSREFAYDETSVKPTAIADAEGRFRLEGVEAAPYESAPANAHILFLTGASPNHTGSPYDMKVALADEDGVCTFDLELTPATSSLSVVFFEAGGSLPATGLKVWLVDEAHNFVSHVSNERGEVDFGRQPPGRFGLFANREQRLADGNHGSLRLEVELGAGEQQRLELELRSDPATSLEGRVLDLAGAPVAGAFVRLSYKLEFEGLLIAHSTETGIADDDGVYRFSGLRAGRYQLEPATCEYPEGAEFDLAWGEQRTGEDLISASCLEVTGQVDLGEREHVGLWLQLYDAETEAMVHFARPEEDGSFRFEGIRAGEYYVVLKDFVDGDVLDLDLARVNPKNAAGLVLRIP